MRLIDRYEQYDPRTPRTIYTVELDDGRTIDVMRNHFPEWGEKPLTYVMDPHDEDINEREVLQWLRKNGPKEDFMMPVLEVQRPLSFAPIADTCFSMEQAVFLAEKKWAEHPSKDQWRLFRIRNGNEVLRDWLNDQEENV